MKTLLCIAAACALLFGCSKPYKAAHVERAFYYWKNTSYSLWGDDSILSKQKVNKLYIKYFEVENDSVFGNKPVAKNRLSLRPDQGENFTVVPTVFIRNEVFLKISHAGLDSLADNVNFLIGKYSSTEINVTPGNIKEYQMDCDWTPRTKDNYFYFLKKLKQLSGKQISCTLRLYPYKYPNKMGIPPVDKAMLMCYNLTHPLDQKESNSILDTNELRKYLSGAGKYPLKLDIALPVYSWCQVYQNNQFKAIIYDDSFFNPAYKKVKPLWYEVTEDTVAQDIFIRKGDYIKYEKVTAQDIIKTIELLKQYVPLEENITVSLFHLDANQLKKYKNEEVSGFYSAFSR